MNEIISEGDWLDVAALARATGGALTSASYEPAHTTPRYRRFHAEIDYANGFTLSISWDHTYQWFVGVKVDGNLLPSGALPDLISPCDQIVRVDAGEIEAIAHKVAALRD